MKTNTIYKISLMMFACMLLVACTEKTEIDYESGELVPLVISAIPNETRTALAEDGRSIVWQAADEIAVYDYIAPKHKFAIESFDKSKARFLGKITAKKDYFLTLYPYSLGADNLTESNALSVQLPGQQTAQANTFAPELNISVGKGARNVDGSPSILTFYNVCQLLKFEVPDYVAGKISEIKFIANTPVAGNLTIDCSADVPVASITADGSKEITILPSTGTTSFASGTYYIVTAPVQMNGFTMSFDCDDKSYSLSSKSTFGGSAGKIYSLGKIDLVNTPYASAVHVYDTGILLGTKLTLTSPTLDEREWTAVVKNTKGDVVRTMKGIGTLSSAEEDENWPYLPLGEYNVEYSFVNSNDKKITREISFNVTEAPRFSISNYAYTSFSYYKGDGVEKDIEIANGLDNMTIYEPCITINGIDVKILKNSNYTFTPESSVTSGLIGRRENVITYNSYKVASLQSYTLTGKVTFDGVSASSSKIVYITGLPYTAAPPTSSDWGGNSSAYSWTGEYVRLHKHTIKKTFYCPENILVNVAHSVNVYRAWSTFSTTTYTLSCSGSELKKIQPGQAKGLSDNKSYPSTLTASNSVVSCAHTAGGNDNFTGEGTNAKVYKISVLYR